MGLWSKVKGAFGGGNDNGDSGPSAYEQYEEDISEEPRAESAYDDFREKAEKRDSFQEEYEEAMREAKEAREQERREEERAEREEAGRDREFEKAEREQGERWHKQDELLEKIRRRQEREEAQQRGGTSAETERERIVRERKERIEDLQQEEKIASFVPKTETERDRESRERRERIEDLRQEGRLSEAESKYTRTGQLKTELKGAARETFFGKKKRVDGKDIRSRSGAADRATRAIRGVSTLGGAVHISKARKHLYTPKVGIDYYVPGRTKITKGATSLYSASGMKELHTPQSGMKGLHMPQSRQAPQTGALRKAGTPSYEHLRQATTFKSRQAAPFQSRTTQPTTTSPLAKMSARTPTHLAKPMGFVKIGSQAQDVAAERLRGLTFPTGLTSSEKLAYAEIKANHDIDTKSHVVSELMDLGIDKMEALRAVEGLMQRRVVKRSQSFEGESTLEIA